MDEDFVERRKDARLDVNSFVNYRITDSCKKRSKVPCMNVSLGGLRFLAKEELAERTTLDLDIYLSPKDRVAISTKGEVVWQAESQGRGKKGYDTGASILEITDADKKRFADFVFANLYDLVGLPDWPRGTKT